MPLSKSRSPYSSGFHDLLPERRTGKLEKFHNCVTLLFTTPLDMPFPYTYICDLLQKLEDELLSSKKQKTPSNAIVANWFESHRSRLNSPDNDAGALLSTLLPERRTDRVYIIQAARLHSILGHALGLGHSRVLELRRHMTPGSGVDLGDCVESILTSTVSI